VATETGRQRKLIAGAVMAVTKVDDKIADVRVPDWSYQVITFSRADMWAKLPQPGHFPLVLDLVIHNVRFEKVLIDGGSALDILFRNVLIELGLKQEDLEPYDAPF
jgi:hypothetical protein